MNDKRLEVLLLSSSSVNDFLRSLSQDPQTAVYLRQFVPVWESASMQKSYEYCPRILFFNEDVSLVMSVVDCPSIAKGREDVEVLQWNKEKKEFELYSINYDVRPTSLGSKNPETCMRCHKGGIAIGATDPYTWPNTSLTTQAFRLTNLGATQKTQSATIFEQGVFIKSIPTSRYQHFDVLNLIKSYPYLQVEKIEKVWQAGMEVYSPINLVEPSLNPTYQPKTPMSLFNQKLASKNHERNVAKAKTLLGRDYEKYKYFIVAALSDCENFSKFYPENPNFPDPYSSREGYEILQKIYERIGLTVLQPRIHTADNFHSAVYAIKQLDSVRKIYYGFLSLNKDEEVKELNFNPIKFTFHPAWGSADMLSSFIMDTDFQAIRKIADIDTIAYLQTRSGIPNTTTEIGKKWQKLADLFVATKQQAMLSDLFVRDFDRLYYEDADFINYCDSLLNLYQKKFPHP